MKLSDLKTNAQVVAERRATDPEFRAEWDRTAFAREVAITVLKYRTDRNLSQRGLADAAGLTQPVIARLEVGEHPPSLATLAKLSRATGLVFHVQVAAGAVELVAA